MFIDEKTVVPPSGHFAGMDGWGRLRKQKHGWVRARAHGSVASGILQYPQNLS